MNTALPSITISRYRLSTSTGTWTSAPLVFAYQWLRCDSVGGACREIGGAVGKGYHPRSADIGFTLRARVTATNQSGSASATSGQTPVVTKSRR